MQRDEGIRKEFIEKKHISSYYPIPLFITERETDTNGNSQRVFGRYHFRDYPGILEKTGPGELLSFQTG
jgi:hypothetical protein